MKVSQIQSAGLSRRILATLEAYFDLELRHDEYCHNVINVTLKNFFIVDFGNNPR